MTDDEVLGIFQEAYPNIRRLATEGDTEAMVMVAQSIRYGFIEDDEEPFFFWLIRAMQLGDEQAKSIVEEIERLENPLALSMEFGTASVVPLEVSSTTDLLLLGESSESESESIEATESVLISGIDEDICEQFGIEEYLSEKEKIRQQRELLEGFCEEGFNPIQEI